MTTTLPLFWHLSSSSKKERLDASVKLVGALEQFQAQFVAKPNQINENENQDSDREEEESGVNGSSKADEELDMLNAHDVSYSIRRLVRGLASPRESSRLGFAVALTELLSRINTITCSQIINLIMASSKTQGSMSGQEERDVLFARLFGFMSVIRSGLLVRTTPLATSPSSNTSPSTLSSYKEVIKELLDLGEKKSWLRESAWFTISLAVDALEESDVEWKEDAVDATLEHVFVNDQTWSPEKIALVIKLQGLYPSRDWQKLLVPTFKNSTLLSSANLQTVSRILKDSAVDEEGHKDPSKAPSGSWKPQLHFAWDVILDQLLPGPNSKQQSKGSFQEFFKVAVDESLFSSTSSPQRKYWGFQVFQRALKRVNQDNMPMLFTKNFMRSWINHLSNKDRYLHKIAQQTVVEVQAFVKDKPQLGFALILQLTGVNGSQQFDKLTKTKTVESILASMNVEGIQNYVTYLFEQFNENDSETPSDAENINTRRTWIIDQLSALIRNGGILKSDEWIQSALVWLVVHGLFVVKKKSSKSTIAALHRLPNPPVSEEQQQVCRNRLLTCLGELSGQTTVVKLEEKSTQSCAVASDGEFWISKVISTIQTLEADTKHVNLINEIEEEEEQIFSQATELLTRLKSVSGDDVEAARGAELLLLALLLQQYCDEDRDSDSLESCISAISRMSFLQKNGKKSKKKGKDKAKAAESAEDTDEPEPIDVLTDIIIGLLESSTAYNRTIANQAFGHLSGSVKESTIDLLIAQLERRSPTELVKDDEDEDEDEDEEMADEKEGGEGDEKEGEDDASSDSDDSFGEIDLGDSAEDEEIDPEIRKKIEEALRVNGIQPATGETDDEDEELMDDDQMMAIDEQLAKVFQSQSNEKKRGKDVNAQREATHFKNRVLDLLDIFMRKQPTHPSVPRLLMPLVDVVIGSGQDEMQLRDKTKGVLRTRICKAKDHPSDVNADDMIGIITSLHTQARKAHSSDIIEILGYSSVYLAKILVQLGKESALDAVYRQSLEDFLTRKNSSLNSNFFKFYFQRYPSQGWRLRQDVLDLATRAINGYRQTQALQLLEVMITQLSSLDDPTKAITDFMPALHQLLLDLGNNACSEKPRLTAPQLKDLFKLAIVSVRQTKRYAPKASAEIWQPNSWTLLKENLAKSPRFSSSVGLHKMCTQIAQLSDKSKESDSDNKTAKKKRKAEAEPETKAKTKSKKAKVKSSS